MAGLRAVREYVRPPFCVSRRRRRGVVESTARAAYEHGHQVMRATNAMADADPEAHGGGGIFPCLGETGTTAETLEPPAVARIRQGPVTSDCRSISLPA
ncbi:hypothetical protein ACFU6I_42900 [Streptomyces sp. NPDC057486]|uniref:hypothetical protein n=1 Tax=Streptomyces sp. NPDC057486 TaxID=3346145 RepID=UPI0036BB8923